LYEDEDPEDHPTDPEKGVWRAARALVFRQAGSRVPPGSPGTDVRKVKKREN